MKKLRTGAMPPAGMPRPEPAAQTALLTYLESALDREAAARPNPGRAAPHRLNRAEYAERHPRSAGARRRHRHAAAARRLGRRLRQHRRRAGRVARAARALSLGGGEDQRARRGQSRRSPRIPTPTACAATRRRPTRTTSCRPARAAACWRATRSRSTASTPSRSSCCRPTSARSAASRTRTSSRSRVDGERVLLAPVGQRAGVRRRGQERDRHREPARGAAAGARVRARRPAAGGRGVSGQDGGARRQPAAVVRAQHADCHRPSRRAARRERDHSGRSIPRGPATPRAAAACSPVRRPQVAPAADDRACARTIVSHAGAARLSAPGHRRGPDAAAAVLRDRPARGRLRARRRDGAARHPRQPEVPDPRRARSRRRGGGDAVAASATSISRRGSRSSSGAAFPTTS